MTPTDQLEKTVIAELEQRNKELASLLHLAEKSRAESESTIKQQSDELVTLRANSLILEAMEQELRGLKECKLKFHEQSKMLDGLRKQEQLLHQRISELGAERDETVSSCHQIRATHLDLLKKLIRSQDEIVAKDEIILNLENMVKVLSDKCEMLGVNNKDVKDELELRAKSYVESENNLKEFSRKIQFCKHHLEKEVEQLNQELELERSSKVEMSLELDMLKKETKDKEQRITEDGNKLLLANKELLNMQRLIKDYETGTLKTKAWRDELQIQEKTINQLKDELESRNEGFQQLVLQNENLKSDKQEREDRIRSYEEHYVKDEEVDRLKNDLELKYKLELNKQLQKASAAFEQEQNELLQTMRLSLSHKAKLKEESIALPRTPKSHR